MPLKKLKFCGSVEFSQAAISGLETWTQTQANGVDYACADARPRVSKKLGRKAKKTRLAGAREPVCVPLMKP